MERLSKPEGNHRVRTITAYNTIAKEYAQKFADSAGPATERLEDFISLLPGKKVFEVGFGLGKDAQWFIDHGFEYSGIDSTTYYHNRLSKLLSGENVELYNEDIYNFKFSDEKYDGIWAMASLVHLIDTEMVTILSKLCSVLNDNGILYTSLKTGGGALIDETGRYFRLYKKQEFIDLATVSGFKSIKTIPGKPNPTFTSEDSWISYYLKKV